MSKVVCRVSKVKSFASIKKAQNHNFRDQSIANRQHIDPTINNELLFGSVNLAQDCKARIDQADKTSTGKIRSNAVLAVEMILSASPDFFNDPENPQNLDEWTKANVAWLKKEYGPNFVNAVLHKDEQTPHIHAFIIPIDDRNKLNCRAILSGRESLTKLQTNAYDAVKHLGLERGISKDITGATHKKSSDWIKEQLEIDKDKKSFSKAIDKIPVIETGFTKLINIDKAHEYYTEKAKEAVKKSIPSKILSLANDNKDLKEQELLHRKAKQKEKEEKEKAQLEKEKAVQIAEKEKEKTETFIKENINKVDELTIEYNKYLKVAEKNAIEFALKIADNFYKKPETKDKLKLLDNAKQPTRIKIFDYLNKELTKELESKNIDPKKNDIANALKKHFNSKNNKTDEIKL